MDVAYPIDQPAEPDAAAFNQRLLARLEAAIPGHRGDPQHDARWQDTMTLFAALNPRDPAEAVLAVIAIQAADAALDNFARAAQPGASNQDAQRLRSSGLSAGRSYHTAMRTLRHSRPAHPAKPEPPPRPANQDVPEGYGVIAPGAEPIPKIEMFQPRDRFGQPIPLWRRDLMTKAQRIAALAYPRDPELEAAALADEERIMAEQAAASPPPGPSG